MLASEVKGKERWQPRGREGLPCGRPRCLQSPGGRLVDRCTRLPGWSPNALGMAIQTDATDRRHHSFDQACSASVREDLHHGMSNPATRLHRPRGTPQLHQPRGGSSFRRGRWSCVAWQRCRDEWFPAAWASVPAPPIARRASPSVTNPDACRQGSLASPLYWTMFCRTIDRTYILLCRMLGWLAACVGLPLSPTRSDPPRNTCPAN
jgi:hypothetical protein